MYGTCSLSAMALALLGGCMGAELTSGDSRSERTDTDTDTDGLEPNAWGLCDMSGNVYEWTNDWYDVSYGGYGSGAMSTDPGGASSGTLRVFRGGSYYSEALSVTLARRSAIYWSLDSYLVGFRLARSSLSP